MRYIFMDEAGTSAHERVTVVVGLIADADEHVPAAEALALEAMGAVPPEFKNKFVFHATAVFGDKKYHNSWSMTDRLNLLAAMMSIPRRIGMAVTVSAHWRNSVDVSDQAKLLKVSTSQFEHIMAFGQCVAVADRNIRKNGAPNEVATVVAENIPEMHKLLQGAVSVYKEHPLYAQPGHLRTTSKDAAAGYNTQSGDLRITRVRNSVHFVAKSEDPLVQVADACAYGFRRFFCQEKFGVDFVRAIIGDERDAAHFASPGGTECWWFHRDRPRVPL